jgi:isochorismate pyruvate lyase
MTSDRVTPAECRTMAEVRHGVDRLDEAMVALLAERFRYMEAAARIKPGREQVRDEWRKADVLAKVRAAAAASGAPVERIAALYDALVESSIAYEFDRFDATRPSAGEG